MRYLIVIGLLALSGCINQRKVSCWLQENRAYGAGYCAKEFPFKEVEDTVVMYVDSSNFFEAYSEMSLYADSLINVIRNQKTDTINVDSLKRSIEKGIRRKLRPCIDSVKVVTRYIENTAKVEALELENKTLKDTITKRDQTVSEFYGILTKYKRIVAVMFGVLLINFLAFGIRNFRKVI